MDAQAAIERTVTDLPAHLHGNLRRIHDAWMAQQQAEMENTGRPGGFAVGAVRSMVEQYGEPAYRYHDITAAEHRLHTVHRLCRFAGVALAVGLLVSVVAFFATTTRTHQTAGVVIALFIATGLTLFPIWTIFLPLPQPGYGYVEDYGFVEGITASTSPHAVFAYERTDLRSDSSTLAVLTVGGTGVGLTREQLSEALHATRSLLALEAQTKTKTSGTGAERYISLRNELSDQ